jgi:hypothetical protein
MQLSQFDHLITRQNYNYDPFKYIKIRSIGTTDPMMMGGVNNDLLINKTSYFQDKFLGSGQYNSSMLNMKSYPSYNMGSGFYSGTGLSSGTGYYTGSTLHGNNLLGNPLYKSMTTMINQPTTLSTASTYLPQSTWNTNRTINEPIIIPNTQLQRPNVNLVGTQTRENIVERCDSESYTSDSDFADNEGVQSISTNRNIQYNNIGTTSGYNNLTENKFIKDSKFVDSYGNYNKDFGNLSTTNYNQQNWQQGQTNLTNQPLLNQTSNLINNQTMTTTSNLLNNNLQNNNLNMNNLNLNQQTQTLSNTVMPQQYTQFNTNSSQQFPINNVYDGTPYKQENLQQGFNNYDTKFVDNTYPRSQTLKPESNLLYNNSQQYWNDNSEPMKARTINMYEPNYSENVNNLNYNQTSNLMDEQRKPTRLNYSQTLLKPTL